MQRLLVVDHDDVTRDRMCVRLGDSFETYGARDPEQAMSLALRHHPDGILVDLEMPQQAGVELCQTLRNLSFTSQIPIFAIAEKTSSIPASQYPELGVASFFERPVDLEEIKNRLIYVLEGPRVNRRAHPRIRMRTILKLRGNDAAGNHFDELTATENVSVGGFLCNSTTPLEINSTVEVLLVSEGERLVGRARLAHKENFVGPWQRYGFHFDEKTTEWVVQE